MTVQPTAAEMIDVMREKARELWGDEFTLEATLWEDGDYRLVTYHRDYDALGIRFEELWHQSKETPPYKAILTATVQPEHEIWAADRGDAEGDPELVDLS